MFVTLDNFFRSTASLGFGVIVMTTCVMVIYLLFYLTPIIESLIQKDIQKAAAIVVKDKEIHIDIKNRTYEFNFKKIRGLFWKLILISYLIGIAMGFAIVVIVPLVIVLILWIRKCFKFGITKGVRQVLRIASPK